MEHMGDGDLVMIYILPWRPWANIDNDNLKKNKLQNEWETSQENIFSFGLPTLGRWRATQYLK